MRRTSAALLVLTPLRCAAEGVLRALDRDRGRPLRRWAYASLVVLVAVTTALGADWVARERTFAVAGSSFGAARDRLARSLRLRYEAFTAMSDLSYVVPVIRQVAATVDEADFGFGDAGSDAERMATLRENLRSADWILWARASQQGIIAWPTTRVGSCSAARRRS
ncbi:MAG TPA: hypothetical protein VMZ28_09445 [Kofleriaceae bacterium]|nr:hypothetical protein [Kofleriaceae bacterium]